MFLNWIPTTESIISPWNISVCVCVSLCVCSLSEDFKCSFNQLRTSNFKIFSNHGGRQRLLVSGNIEEPKWEGEGWYCLLQQSFCHLGFLGRDLKRGGLLVFGFAVLALFQGGFSVFASFFYGFSVLMPIIGLRYKHKNTCGFSV